MSNLDTLEVLFIVLVFNIGYFLLPILFVGLVVFAIRRAMRSGSAKRKGWYLGLAASKEEAMGHLFLLLALAFFGIALHTLNFRLGAPLSAFAVLLFASLVGMVGAYAVRSMLILAVSLAGFATGWGLQTAEWAAENNIQVSSAITLLSLLALLFYVVGRIHETSVIFRRFAIVYTGLGVLTVTAVLFFFSTKYGLEQLITELATGDVFLESWQTGASLVGIVVVLAGAGLYAAAKKHITPLEVLAVSLLAALFISFTLLPGQDGVSRSGNVVENWSKIGLIWFAVLNIALFFEMLGMLLLGYARKEVWLINMAAALLPFWVIVKYFDWFFSSLDKGLFFVGAGVLLLALGWIMERGRRHIVARLTPQPQ